MAKTPNGIMGGIRGKVGGVVGGNWRGVNYIRAYAKPGYSNTDAQAAQRSAMGYLVAAAKPFVGRVFNTYSDKFLSRLSGFNWCIRENMAIARATDQVADLKITSGPLYPGSLVSAVRGGVSTVITWNTDTGVDGAAGDVAISYLRNMITNTVSFGVDGVRGDGTVTIPNIAADVAGDVHAGVFFVRMNTAGDVVERISTNLSAVCTE